MACVGVAYTVDRQARTPGEPVAALFRDPGERPEAPPRARQKLYWAELTREAGGEEVARLTGF